MTFPSLGKRRYQKHPKSIEQYHTNGQPVSFRGARQKAVEMGLNLEDSSSSAMLWAGFGSKVSR